MHIQEHTCLRGVRLPVRHDTVPLDAPADPLLVLGEDEPQAVRSHGYGQLDRVLVRLECLRKPRAREYGRTKEDVGGGGGLSMGCGGGSGNSLVKTGRIAAAGRLGSRCLDR